jgi:hypothetical protein
LSTVCITQNDLHGDWLGHRGMQCPTLTVKEKKISSGLIQLKTFNNTSVAGAEPANTELFDVSARRSSCDVQRAPGGVSVAISITDIFRVFTHLASGS